MGRNQVCSQGERWFLLYQYLTRNAYRGKSVSRQQLLDHLAGQGIQISVNTLYADLSALQGEFFGLEIEFDCHAHRGAGGYWIKNPPFDPNDLRLIVDSVQASQFITQAKADKLSRKLRQLTGSKVARSLNRSAVVFNRIKSMNETVVDCADRFYAAIASNRKIAFRYFHRTPDREHPQKYSKSGSTLIVSPYALVWDKGCYYLYAYDGRKFKTYRIDRMDNISEPLFEEREGLDAYRSQQLTRQKAVIFDMYRGKEYMVRFRCHNTITDAILDRFGKDVMLIPCDDTHFTFTVPVEISPPFFAWAATFGRKIRILEPAPVISEMKEFIQTAASMYEDDET